MEVALDCFKGKCMCTPAHSSHVHACARYLLHSIHMSLSKETAAYTCTAHV